MESTNSNLLRPREHSGEILLYACSVLLGTYCWWLSWYSFRSTAVQPFLCSSDSILEWMKTSFLWFSSLSTHLTTSSKIGDVMCLPPVLVLKLTWQMLTLLGSRSHGLNTVVVCWRNCSDSWSYIIISYELEERFFSAEVTVQFGSHPQNLSVWRDFDNSIVKWWNRDDCSSDYESSGSGIRARPLLWF